MRPKVLFLCTALSHSSAGRRIRDASTNDIDIVVFDNSEDKIKKGLFQRIFSTIYVRMALFIIQNPADVVWCWGHDACFVGSFVSFFFPRARVVWDVSDIGAHLLNSSPTGWVFKALERLLIRRARALFLTSERFYDEYYSRKIARGRVRVIENKWEGLPPNHRLFNSTAPRIRVVYVGLFRTARVIRVIGAVCRRLSNVIDFHFYGTTSENEIAEELSRVTELPNVLHFGPFDHADIQKMYRDASLVWGMVDPLYSLNERWLLPNRVYDGIATGIPVLCTIDTASGDYVLKNNAGVAVPLDEDRICALLEQFSSNRQVLTDLAQGMPPMKSAYLNGDYAVELTAIASDGDLVLSD